jgi:hypothetical protein
MGLEAGQMLEFTLASMQGSSCHTINDYYLPKATRLCWSSTHPVMCTSRTEHQSSSTSCILALSHYVSSCKSSSNFHLPCCVINSLHAGQWAQGYARNSEQCLCLQVYSLPVAVWRCNCCTDGMFDNMHNNGLTEVVVNSTQAGYELWPSWCAAQKLWP